MYKHIAKQHPKDGSYPARTSDMLLLKKVLDGTFYDILPFAFHEEYGDNGEYISINKRAPSVRSNLCRVVVQDTVALLFSEGRFPTVETNDSETRSALMRFVKESGLNRTMIDAAQRGSIGSIVLHLRILNNRVFVDAMDTVYLTPRWKPDEPDCLLDVVECYKVRGQDLIVQGYDISADRASEMWWFRRCWTETEETWFLPQSSEDASAVPPKPPVRDAVRSTVHGLGFVPMVWVRNLPGGVAPDGACTFRAAIETVVDLDYLLSAGQRALMYQAAPRLVVKEPSQQADQMQIGPGDALIVSEKGDAKLLEISGGASTAIKEFVSELRERALESIHGNRAHSERLAAAQSGRAMELMHQPLIQVADQLRSSYGEEALVRLMQMVIQARQAFDLTFRNGEAMPEMPAQAQVALKWGPWFSPTFRDRQEQATALKTNGDAGHISRESAVKAVAGTEDIEDVHAELARIKSDETAADAREANQAGVKTTETETLPS